MGKEHTNVSQLNFLRPVFVDCFAGGGGWSVGFELATGKPIDIAINHDPDAVLMHQTNHPYTKHYCEDVFEVTPKDAVWGRKVVWAHFSPDCKHFSKAKGGKPADKKIRGLAWIVLRWAAEVGPDIISLENVTEFLNWGPVRKGKPVKKKSGQTFSRWKKQLEDLGYAVEYKVLVACDYGAPTSRQRLFVLARRDGKPIVWPQPSHGDPDGLAVRCDQLLPWRTAADIIDWTLPAPSIFDDKKAIKSKYGLKAVRPLADNTQRRIIRGVDKFVLKSDSPYIISNSKLQDMKAPSITIVNHAGEFRGQAVTKPLQTITGKHGYGVVEPILSPVVMANNENAAGSTPAAPVGTITTGGHHMLIAPTLLQYHSEQKEQVRGQNVNRPICTVDATNRYALVAPVLTKYYGNDDHGQSADSPLHTITSKDREGVLEARLEKYEKEDDLYAAHITKYYSGGYKGVGTAARSPLSTITMADHNALVTTTVSKVAGGCDWRHWLEIRELLNKYCGYKLQHDEVLLLKIKGCWYYIADIGLRMLTPKELYAANGFPADYIIDHDYLGREYKKNKQVARCGNAVLPPFATAIVRANIPECCGKPILTMEELNKKMAG